jgi:Protein of unknown function (DUF1360)
MKSSMNAAVWNIFFGVFFLLLVFIGTDWLFTNGRLASFVPLADFFLISLAIFRLIRLVCYDVVTQFVRDWLETKTPGTFLGTLSALIHCPWCAGLWFAFFVTFFYFATPFAWFLILVLALAGIASMFQILANLIGWSAELKKRTVLGPEHKSGSTCG